MERFEPGEIAFLVKEWVLHEKYEYALSQLGGRHLRRAREAILSEGLGSLPSLPAMAARFMTLKLGNTDLAHVEAVLPAKADGQTAELVGLLRRPFGVFFDFGDARSASRLQGLCSEAGRVLPEAEEC